MQHVQQLPLVFMDPLDLDIKKTVRVNRDPAGRCDQPGQSFLVLLFDPEPSLVKIPVIGKRCQVAQMVEIRDPFAANGLGNQGGQAGIGLEQPAPRGDPVGLVVEPAREELFEILENPGPHQMGVQRGHPVHRMTADNGQVGHPHPPLGLLFNQRHVPQPAGLAGETQ